MTKNKRLTTSNNSNYKSKYKKYPYPLLIDEIDHEEDKMDMEYIHDMVKDNQKYKREHQRYRGYNE